MDESPEEEAGFEERLIRHLRSLGKENEWVEFKENNADPKRIGEYVSALANAATVHERPFGYLVWGIRDSDLEIVGTTFAPWKAKKGNDDLQNWLARVIDPQTHLRFLESSIEGKQVVVLEIAAALQRPTTFDGVAFIRIGANKKVLRKHPAEERQLWRALEKTSFEKQIVMADVSPDRVLELIDYPAYFELTSLPMPEGRSKILEALQADQFIVATDAQSWSITALGAILFARDLSQFERLRRKAIRVVQYQGDTRADPAHETEGQKGYASGFSGLIGHINTSLPSNEVMGEALRKEVPAYPPPAVRELVANALIHQDLTIGGSGPMIEIFDSRLEITNPGRPINDPRRLIDLPPISRNEQLAAVMRRIGVCEERGSGWDKIMFEIEYNQLPPPGIETSDVHTRISLYSSRPFSEMEKAERIEAVYLHSCLRHVTHRRTTNGSVRERFGIAKGNSAIASRLISETIDAGLIAPYDANAGKKYMSYQPFWA